MHFFESPYFYCYNYCVVQGILHYTTLLYNVTLTLPLPLPLGFTTETHRAREEGFHPLDAIGPVPPYPRPATSVTYPREQRSSEMLGAAVRGSCDDLGRGPDQQGGYLPDDAG